MISTCLRPPLPRRWRNSNLLRFQSRYLNGLPLDPPPPAMKRMYDLEVGDTAVRLVRSRRRKAAVGEKAGKLLGWGRLGEFWKVFWGTV